MPSRIHSAPMPFGPWILCAVTAIRSGSFGNDHPPKALHRVAQQPAATMMRGFGKGGDRLDRPDLVIDQHHRDEPVLGKPCGASATAIIAHAESIRRAGPQGIAAPRHARSRSRSRRQGGLVRRLSSAQLSASVAPDVKTTLPALGQQRRDAFARQFDRDGGGTARCDTGSTDWHSPPRHRPRRSARAALLRALREPAASSPDNRGRSR